MAKHVYSAIGTIISCLIIYWIWNVNDQTQRHNIHYNEAVVTAIGQCNGEECSFTYKTEFGTVRTGLSKKPVSIGQKVYQMCWEEKARGHRCYVDYEPN